MRENRQHEEQNHEIVTCFSRLYHDSYKLKTIRTNTEFIGIYRVFDKKNRSNTHADKIRFMAEVGPGGVTIYIYIML